MNFAKALAAMEQGHRVARRSWEGNAWRQTVALSPPGTATTASSLLKQVDSEEATRWMPQYEDLSATDWEQVSSRECNMCGFPCGTDEVANMGLLDARVEGGYGSTPGNGDGALDDCSAYKFSLCEYCLDWLFSNFRTPPKVTHFSPLSGERPDEEEAFRPAHQRVAEDKWRGQKARFVTEAAKRAAARKIEP